MVLALDLASKQSGWAVFNGKDLINYGIIKPRPLTLQARQRLPQIADELERLIEEYGIKEVILEQPAGGKEDNRGPDNNWLTMSVLFLTQGAICYILERRKVKYSFISPSTWQNRLGINKRDRQGRKEGAKNYAVQHYGLADNLEQDIYDAICLFDCNEWLKVNSRPKEEDLQWR